jgi:hypothetical protein
VPLALHLLETNGAPVSEIKKENERKKKQGRTLEEGIIKIISRKNSGGNNRTFLNSQLYGSFVLPVTLRKMTQRILFWFKQAWQKVRKLMN